MAAVTLIENQVVSRIARPGRRRSSPLSRMFPPSRGSTGIRFISPIIGPAHQMASVASDARNEVLANGLTRMTASRATLVTIWVAGPANEIHACSALDRSRVGTYEA